MDDDILTSVSNRLTTLLPTTYAPLISPTPQFLTSLQHGPLRLARASPITPSPYNPTWPLARPPARPQRPLPAVNEADIADVMRLARASSTSRQYDSVIHRYEDLLRRVGASPWPASGYTITTYITSLVQSKTVTSSTIKHYVGIITSSNKARGGILSLMDEEHIRLSLRGSQRALGTPDPLRTCTLTPPEIQTLATLTPTSGRMGSTVACLIGIAGLLRLQELANLRPEDITFHHDHNSPYCEIQIRSSKTDIGSRGAQVLVGCASPTSVLCTTTACPLHRLHSWTALCHYKDESTPLFNCTYAQLRDDINDLINRVATAPGRRSTHALRRTGTSLLLSDYPILQVAEHGRWTSTAAIDRHYSRGHAGRKQLQIKYASSMFNK